MADCCHNKSCEVEALARRQSRVLWTVLALNAVMFGVELSYGLLADSLSLLGDSLDMLGDALAYGTSIWALSRGPVAKARSAQVKGVIMVAVGLGVCSKALLQLAAHPLPEAAIMGPVGALALGVNALCLLLLTRHRADDVNMKAVWLCSRNDIVANLAVLGAAGLVAYTKTPWPDLMVGLGITILFLKSAATVFGDAQRDLGLAAAPVERMGHGGTP